ncbi:protein phosphatase 2C domain-containing protein [Cryptosporangium arvum]|uniref:protein phosphatase 2C domain-containing protein n=1 Tax=Cryptosporangium arvum TaxID=80871 RepID=UPI000560BEF2|nr:protein phosphatase 2C domain-containing protein [Cryptosporangium arvum]
MTCTRCAAPAAPTDVFCEACGADLPGRPPAAPGGSDAVGGWLGSGAAAGRCAHCGADASIGGYCGECGRRRGAGRDRAALELPGVAALTDRGTHRHHNEDAVAIGRTPAGPVAVVCDGVSSSPRADAAAVAACEAALPALLRALTGGGDPGAASLEAFDDALAAVDALVDTVPADAPSCTYVSGVVTGEGMAVSWAGDSRAYWIPDRGAARCLTEDDARPDTPGAPLTRWLGADAPGVGPHVVAVPADGPGLLLLCTDGLSRYLAGPADLARVAGSPPAAAARELVGLALDAGGADNIAVALLAVPSIPGGELP